MRKLAQYIKHIACLPVPRMFACEMWSHFKITPSPPPTQSFVDSMIETVFISFAFVYGTISWRGASMLIIGAHTTLRIHHYCRVISVKADNNCGKLKSTGFHCSAVASFPLPLKQTLSKSCGLPYHSCSVFMNFNRLWGWRTASKLPLISCCSEKCSTNVTII